MNTIEQIHSIVWAFRKANDSWWLTPTPDDCIRYAFTEAGELMEAYLRAKRPGDARNNVKLVEIDHELADVVIMLVSAVPNIPNVLTPLTRMKPEIDDICACVGFCLDDFDDVDIFVMDALIFSQRYAEQHNIDLVAQVRKNLEAIEQKHYNKMGLKPKEHK